MNQQENNLIRPSPIGGHFLAEGLAETLCLHLALDHQVLLRLFRRKITGEFDDAQLAALLQSFSLELPKRKRVFVEEIAGNMESGMSFLAALESFNVRRRGRNMSFSMMEQTLRSAEEQAALPAFLRAVSNYRPERLPLALRYRDTMRKRLIRLAIKTFVILQVIGFIFLFIVPEFQKLFTEYGIELPLLMRSAMFWADMFSRYVLPWVLLLFLVFFFYCLYNSRRWTARVVANFGPWNWLQRPLSKRGKRKLSWAISNLSGGVDSVSDSVLEKKELDAIDVARSAEARAWLVRRSVKENIRRRAVWKNRSGDAFVLGWNLFLACVVAAIAISVVSCLVTIVEGLV